MATLALLCLVQTVPSEAVMLKDISVYAHPSLGQVQLQHTAQVAEGQVVVIALGIHGELGQRAVGGGLHGGQLHMDAVGGRRGGIVGAEGGVARLTAHVVEQGHCGGCLWGGGVERCSFFSYPRPLSKGES